ncbi:MAG: hypothetical protein H0V84_05100 [Actinobacteria bacterium]|nr:hypothetical protein [Actinomycetota bacterium]
MTRTAAVLALLLLLLLLVAAPATAAAAAYRGKTKSGTSITFTLSGPRISAVRTSVPATCIETTGTNATRAGVELFQPPSTFALGATGKTKALQPAAMNRGVKATKNYTFSSKRGAGGKITGTLRVSFSFLGLGADPYHSLIYVCTGSSTFTASPR